MVDPVALEEAKAFSKLGGRKFTVCMIVILLATLALGLHWIGEETWKTVVMAALAAYMASNVAQKYVLKDTPTATAADD